MRAGALVPSLQHQPPVVHAVVVVEVREERVRDVDGAMAALDQPMMRAGTVIPDDQIGADLDQVAGALPRQRRRRRAGAEQRDGQRLRRRGRLCGVIIRGRERRGQARRGRERADEFPAIHDQRPPAVCGCCA